jgi:hypothetical protein
LSHSDLRAVAKHFAGKDSVRLGEELVGHVIPGMFDRDSGRVVPSEVLRDLGEGDPIAGRKVLRKFLDNIRRRPMPNLQELQRRMPPIALRRLLGGTANITVLSINPENE